MPYQYNTPEGYEDEEITAVIAESLVSHLAFAQRRLAAYQASCTTFEQRHGMSTEEFLDRFDAAPWGSASMVRLVCGGAGEKDLGPQV